MLYIISFIILLSIIVVVHELGHLLAAKAFGVYCSEFSVGMGKEIFSKQFKETKFAIRLLPIGGFVAMAGDNDNALESSVDIKVPENRTLKGIAKWKKIIILLAGPMMNFLLAWLIISGIVLANGFYALPGKPMVGAVIENSPAQMAGFEANDYIKAITFEDGSVVYPKTDEDLLVFTYNNTKPLTYTVERDNQQLDILVTPELDETSGVYKIGFYLPETEYATVDISNFLGYGMQSLIQNTKTIFTALSQLFTGSGYQNLSGPIGIFQTTSQAVDLGGKTFVLLIALLSLNVGIFNLLPLPILDGGRIVLTCVEAVIRKPLSEKFEMAVMTLSMVILIGIMIFATFQDILRLF